MTVRLSALVTLAVIIGACSSNTTSSVEPDAGAEPDVVAVDVALPEDTSTGPAACESNEACAALLAESGEDGGPCRAAVCGDDGVCAWEALADGLSCDDDDPCTEDTVCDAGACLGRYICAACAATSDCASLEDGNLCNGTLHCVQGQCEVDPDSVPECPQPSDPCRMAVCLPATGVCDERDAPAGMPCDDDDACTVDDVCQAGLCAGTSFSCEDGDACTAESCDAVDGCTSEPVVCDDDDACTVDYCDTLSGCVFAPRPCDDGNLCTIDSCDAELGCQFVARDCDDGDACTIDTCRPGSGCAHRELLCDDGDPLTDDACDPGTGQCVNSSPQCDDGDPCTIDSWDATAGECRTWARSCNDGDPCTVDSCDSAQGCVQTPYDCNDQDPCTADSCTPFVGCQYAPLSGPVCDDGRECSTGDVCIDGVCRGDDSACVCPAPDGPATKFLSLQIGPDGHPGHGLDLDGDPETCAPAGSCSGGIDNALASVAALSNPYIAEEIEGGGTHLLLQHEGFRFDGQPYVVNGWLVEPDDPSCDDATGLCGYWLDPRAFDEDCDPTTRMGDATVVDGQISAGGPGYLFSFEFPLVAGIVLDLVFYDARLEGTLTLDEHGQPSTMNAILAGAIRKDDLRETLLMVPPDDLPISQDILLNAIDLLLVADMDTDGDGVDDAASAALVVEGGPAVIVGTTGEL